jgi:L-cysteine:1D-myo-inositol 2-amino-2-deoxy-alpha-D-glucopyranoside ligase
LRYLLGENFLNYPDSNAALITLQGGGSDLIFPHHFMSGIQVEAMTGRRFAQVYVHAGMIGLDGEKMSKSRGNLVFVSKLLADGVDPMAIRLALLSSHYATDRMWSAEILDVAKNRLSSIKEALSRNEVASTSEVVKGIAKALAADLNTPEALSILDHWIARTNSGDSGGSAGELARALDGLLGISL